MPQRTWFALCLLAYLTVNSTLCVHLQPGSSCPPTDDGYDADVLIIGAGLAGITAAKTLHERGVTNLLVLEAHDSIGGRLRSENFGGMRVEIGSHWMFGVHDPVRPRFERPYKKNPVLELMQACGLQSVIGHLPNRVLYNVTGPFDMDYTVEQGFLFDKMVQDLSRYSLERKKKYLPDVSVREAFDTYGWKINSNFRMLLDAAFFSFIYQQTAEETSFYKVFPPIIMEFGETGRIITDQRGSEHLVRCVADNFNLTGSDQRLHLNTLVKEIKWNGECVCVTAKQGTGKRRYCAKYAVSTVSIGELQSDESVLRFDPPLPKWKRDAINKFGMTHVLRVFVKFNYSFWDQVLFIDRFDKIRGRYPTFQPLDSPSYGIQTPQPAHVLLFTVLDKMADIVLAQPLEKTKEEILDVLQSVYPKALIPEPEDIMITKWKEDPLFRGTSVTYPVGVTDRDYDDLSATIGRLHFSGSATHKTCGGILQGAYFAGKRSGEEIADNIMYVMNNWL